MGKHTDGTRRERAAAYAREALRRKGMSQKALTEATGLDKGTVSAFLTGARWPTVDTRDEIERALDLPAGSFERVYDGVEDSTLSAESGNVPSNVVREERGELSGQRIVRVHIDALGVDVQTTLGDDEDRAAVIAQIMESVGLERAGIDRERGDAGGGPA